MALMPVTASAAGLGTLTVYSGLGEPFLAEIEISADKAELSELSARIAPGETYDEQGIDRPATLNSIRVDLGTRADGSTVLKLSTPHPVNEPFLDMLIQVDWPTGRLLREYTTLLDPPGYGGSLTATPPAPAVRESTAADQAPSKKKPSERSPGLAKGAQGSASKPLAAEEEGGYTVKRGDTLRSIAQRMQPDDVSLEQMLVGLFRNNHNAFAGDNMNRLIVGKILQAPGMDELQSVPQQEAQREIRVHTQNWNAYRNQLAGVVAQAAPVESEPSSQESGGKIAAPAEDMAEAPVAGPRDVVKLSKVEADRKAMGAASEQAGVAADKVRSLEEESVAQDQAVKEITERIAFFEKQIQDMQQLLVVQNQILAELQKGTPALATPAPQEAAQPQPQPSAPPQPEAPAPKPIQEPAEEPNPLDALTQNPLLLAGAGGGLALLGGIWLFLRSKRRKGLDSFERGILTSGGVGSDTVMAAGAGAAAGASSLLADFTHHTGEGAINASDVDPISEAEVYMAYGRDAQAEEILKDAIAKEPKRYELHRKLLEIYANRKDITTFEALAGELYATLGTTNPDWIKVAELGRELEPDNPMYAAASGAGAMGAAYGGLTEQDETGVPDEHDVAAEEAESSDVNDSGLDFDLGQLDKGFQEEGAEEVTPESLQATEMAEPFAETEDSFADAEGKAAGLEFGLDLPETAADESLQLGADDLGMQFEESEAAESDLLPELPEVVSATEAEGASAASSSAEPLEETDFATSPNEAVAVSEEAGSEEPIQDIGFELPELSEYAAGISEPEQEETAAELPVAEMEVPESWGAEFAAVMDSSEAPEAVLELPAVEAEAEVQEAATESSLPEITTGVIEVTPETSAVASAGVKDEAEAVLIDEPESEEAGLDFDFNVDMDEALAAEPEAPSEAKALPDLDFSSIDLDLEGGKEPEAAGKEEITLSGSESPDVDTKLDLVTAYMDMGDMEGARELLEEVLSEGGPKQRERAQKLMDSLS